MAVVEGGSWLSVMSERSIMKTYQDIDRDSGVIAYDYGPDWIHVRFSDLATYRYTYKSAGAGNVEEMKRLADSGEGLNAFINTNVKFKYERRLE